MNTNSTARAEAVAWLVGRLRWEQLLTELQARADDAAEHAADGEVRGTAEVATPATRAA